MAHCQNIVKIENYVIILWSMRDKSISNIFDQAKCDFSQMIDIKHIRRDFHSVTWVMPQGWDFGKGTGGLGSKILSQNSTKFGV